MQRSEHVRDFRRYRGQLRRLARDTHRDGQRVGQLPGLRLQPLLVALAMESRRVGRHGVGGAVRLAERDLRSQFCAARFDTSGWSAQQVFDTEGMGWELNCVENVGFVLQIGMSNNAIGGNESTIVWSIPLGEVQCMVPITLANPVVANNIEAGITFTAWPATITVTPA